MPLTDRSEEVMRSYKISQFLYIFFGVMRGGDGVFEQDIFWACNADPDAFSYITEQPVLQQGAEESPVIVPLQTWGTTGGGIYLHALSQNFVLLPTLLAAKPGWVTKSERTFSLVAILLED